MQTGPGCAVAACLDDADLARLERALAQAGWNLAASARSAGSLVSRIADIRPGLVVADAVLPGADGAALARRVASMPLEVYPALILARPAKGLAMPGEASLRTLNAAVTEKPVTPEAISALLGAIASRAAELPPDKARRLEALLNAVGVPDHPGRDMLYRAAALAWRDRRRTGNLRDRLYPDAGAPFGRTPAQAERAIRHVIDAAWRTGEIDRQNEIFGNTIDARRGRPTCGEMIAQLADILRWEG